MKRISFIFSFLLSLIFGSVITVKAANPIISEFMAINNHTLQDEDGDYSDWLEIYNPGSDAVNLQGWCLTDNPDKLSKWQFPSVVLNGGGYLVVFASEKDRRTAGSNLHTNFKLSGSGEYLALVKSDKTTIVSSFGESFPVQQSDVSYGVFNGNYYYLEEPTPGAANTIANQVLMPEFSQTRGFYTEPFNLELTVADASLKIYYTTNGTRPNATTGTLYNGSIPVTTTTPVSAVSLNADGDYSAIVTHTYLFLADVIQQPAAPEGYPSEWSPWVYAAGNSPADYEMDPEVCYDPAYASQMQSALMAIPTLCIVTNIGYIFSHDKDDHTGGIYIYTGKTGGGNLGLEWERPTSIEYIDPLENKDFQLNCKIQLHGGNSRVPDNSPKHSFRVAFNSDYGPSKLNYNLFDYSNATNKFDDLVLRAGYNYSWTKNNETQRTNADNLRDPFAKNTQLDMGWPSAHNKFVHLYINGLYWGVYNLSEKITKDFMESYIGGDKDEWDVIKEKTTVQDGNIIAWNALINQSKSGLSTNAAYQKVQGNNENGTRNTNYDNLLDVDNLIDYMIFNIYIGNEDWDHNNWLAARNRVAQTYGFRFFAWDAETTMTDLHANMVDENNSGNPSSIYTNLRQNEEFAVRFGDRLQKHFFNGGALTPEATAVRYQKLADEIDQAIIAESARWGDYRRDVSNTDNTKNLYTRNDFWLPEVEDKLATYLPQRSDIVLEQFRSAGLFPTLDAPLFSHYGGKIESSIDLEMTAEEGDIYYTTDGSDPRKTGGDIASSAVLYSHSLPIAGDGTLKARARKGTEWSALTEATFNGDKDEPFIVSTQEYALQTGAFSYPNPFSKSTTIQYTLPDESNVCLQVSDLFGHVVETLYSGNQVSGTHSVRWNASGYAAGIYFYQITCNGQRQTGKMVLSR